MTNLKLKTHIISEEFFQFALVTYLMLTLAETVKTGFVSNFLNPNIILGIVLLGGVTMVLTHEGNSVTEVRPKKITGNDIQNFILLAVGGGLLVYFKTQDMGTISLI